MAEPDVTRTDDHVIEAVALLLLFVGARRLLALPGARLAAAGRGR